MDYTANRKGRLIVIVGPSGSGKDTLINCAREALADQPWFGVVRRVITRPVDAGGEAHEAATEAEFAQMKQDGRFAVDWQAHGLSYGIPVAARLAVATGKTMLVNGSRRALGQFRSAFGDVDTVLVTARLDILTQRLLARGRETEAEIAERLARQIDDDPDNYDLVIANSGRLDDAAAQLIDFILKN